MNPSATEQAAQLLLQCQQQRSRIPKLPDVCTPETVDDAYQIQCSFAQLLGEPLAGYKVGLTNDAAQRINGHHEPIVGRVYRRNVLQNSARLLPIHSHMRAVEAEVLFKIGSTLRPGEAPFDRARIVASIADVFASIEICDSRFIDCDQVSLASIVADNSNAGVVVIGDRFKSWNETDFDAMTVSLSRSGSVAVEGSTGNVLHNPLNSLTWLANWLAARGMGLEAGQIIATGTCTPVVIGQPGDQFIAQFGVDTRAQIEFM